MKIKTAVAAVVMTLLPFAPHAALARQQQTGTAQSHELRELREEVRRLKEEQEAMRKELRELRQAFEQARGGGQPAMPEFVSVDDDPAQGSADARVVIIDFSDYQ